MLRLIVMLGKGPAPHPKTLALSFYTCWKPVDADPDRRMGTTAGNRRRGRSGSMGFSPGCQMPLLSPA
jgi:hypothetical protein